MNASTRRAAAILRDRRRANSAATRAHSINSHATSHGIADAANTLRKVAKRLSLGHPSRLFKRDDSGRKAWRSPVKNGRRYTIAEFFTIVTTWRPRKPEFKALRSALIGA